MPKRVLIADDSDRVRAVIRSFVEKQPGVEVCALTHDGVETVDVAAALQPDLLILDVLMPGLNGIEVASVLKKRLPGAKTVLFTMYDDAVRAIGPTAGANAVLTKTDGISGLLRTLRRLLSDRLVNVEQVLGRAAQEKQLDARRMEVLTRELNAPLTRCTRDLKYAWVSEQYAAWLQRPVSKIVGRSIRDVMGSEAFNTLRCRFDQVLSGHAVTYEDVAKYNKIGSRRICAAYRPTLQPDGNPDGWLACVEDVTDNQIDEPDRPSDNSVSQVA